MRAYGRRAEPTRGLTTLPLSTVQRVRCRTVSATVSAAVPAWATSSVDPKPRAVAVSSATVSTTARLVERQATGYPAIGTPRAFNAVVS